MEFLMRKILVLGAHYDDIEIGVGGTLFKHVIVGDKVFVAVTASDETKTGDPKLRYEEQSNSISILGIDKKDVSLFNINDDISDIVAYLDKLKPDILYTMFEFDTHQAHRKCSYIGQAIGRKLSTQVIFYNSGTSYDFTPNAFSMISFDFKQKLLKCFESQIALNAINIDIIQRRESYWASLITDAPNSYAEGFVIKKIVYEV